MKAVRRMIELIAWSEATASLKSNSSEVTVTRTANSWRRRRRRRSPARGGGSAGSTAGMGRTAAIGAWTGGAELRRADMCLLTVGQVGASATPRPRDLQRVDIATF